MHAILLHILIAWPVLLLNFQEQAEQLNNVFLNCTPVHLKIPENRLTSSHYSGHKAIKYFSNRIVILDRAGKIKVLNPDNLGLIRELNDSIPYTYMGNRVKNNLLIARNDGSVFLFNPLDMNKVFIVKTLVQPIYVESISSNPDIPGEIISFHKAVTQMRGHTLTSIRVARKQVNSSKPVQSFVIRKTDFPFWGLCENLQYYYDREASRILILMAEGESYGSLIYYDLKKRLLKSVVEPLRLYWSIFLNFNGSIRMSNGKVLLFGCTCGDGGCTVVVFSLQDNCLLKLYEGDYYEGLGRYHFIHIKEAVRLTNKPHDPIVTMIDDSARQKIIVVTLTEVFETDYELSFWKKIYDVKYDKYLSQSKKNHESFIIWNAVLVNSDKLICVTRSGSFIVIGGISRSFRLPVPDLSALVFSPDQYRTYILGQR